MKKVSFEYYQVTSVDFQFSCIQMDTHTGMCGRASPSVAMASQYVTINACRTIGHVASLFYRNQHMK